MFGDPALFDNFNLMTAGYPDSSTSIPADGSGIDWTALECFPAPDSTSASDGLSEHPANSGVESRTSSVHSPDPPFDHHHQQQPATTLTTPSLPSVAITSPMPSATSFPTPSPASRESSPKENPSRVSKRQLNTMAARRYRQRRLDKVTELEAELDAIKRERDELKMRVSKLEGETDALKSMLQDKGK
ncbi:hypothetical protein BJX99DRAFT_229129 [Aspergillus californicus]